MKKKVRRLSTRELLDLLDQVGTEAAWYVTEYRKKEHPANLTVIHANVSAMQAIIEELELDYNARHASI